MPGLQRRRGGGPERRHPLILAFHESNFPTDDVNAANREVDAKLLGDTWIVSMNNGDFSEVPLAAIGRN